MTDIVIKSKDNKKYKSLVDIKNNKDKKSDLILVEGEDLIDMCLESSSNLIEVISLEYNKKYEKYPQYLLSKDLYRTLSSYSSLPRSIGLCEYNLSSYKDDKIIYLDGVQDPGNLGTIERTALALGYKTIVLSDSCVSPYNFKAIQASKGSVFKLNISYAKLEDILNEGYKLFMTSLGGKDVSNIKNIPEKYALVFGNEGQGISSDNLKLGGEKILLPISKEIDSLNVGVAAGIFMYIFKTRG